MKKIYLLILLTSLFYGNLHAAEGPQLLTTGIVVGGGTGGFPHFTPQTGKVTAANHFRLLAKTFTQYNGTLFQPVDSVEYKYSTGRGGLIDPDQPNKDEHILFDNAVTHYYNAGAGAYQNKLYRTQTFDNEDRIKSLKYARWNVLSTPAAWKDSAMYTYSYVQGTKKIDVSLFQLFVGGTWSHDLPSTLTYNGDNVVSISSLDYSATYTYDANNNIISIEDKVATHGSGSLNNNEHKSYTYNSTNNVTTFTLEKWDVTNSVWSKYKYWEYTYNAKNVETSTEYNWSNNAWEVQTKHIYTYNANDDQLSELIQIWSPGLAKFVNSTLETRTFNTNGLIETITTADWDGNSGTWKYNSGNTSVRYYYEYYNPTDVEKTIASSDMQLYPNPATDEIHLSINWETAHETSLCMYNAMGQSVYVSTDKSSKNYTKLINTSSLPSGTYTLLASNGSETRSSKVLINK